MVIARAYRQLGDLLLETGLASDALKRYQKSHAIVLELARAPDPSKAHVPYLNLGRSYANLGRATQRLGDAPRARDLFLQSLKSREQALPLAPDKRFVQQEIAEALSHLGMVSVELGQPDVALEYYRQAVDLRREWVETAPQNANALREFVNAQLALAGIAVDHGHLTDAIEQYNASLEALREVAALDGNSLATRGNIAFVHNQRGTAWLFAEEPEKAKIAYEESVQMFTRLVSEDRQHADLHRKLGLAYYGLGMACLENGDTDASRQHFTRCVEVRQRLAAKDSANLAHQAELMLALARVGEHVGAATIADQIEEHSSGDAGLRYIVACGYALAKAAAGDDPELAASYATSALTALRNAITHGYRRPALMQMDPDLDSIRMLPEFQRLIGELEQRR